MKNLVISIFLLFILANAAQAGCFTGAACSIDGLEKMTYINAIENYFARTVPEPIFVSTNSPAMFYNNLFIFNTIV